jgi:CheY-like chemotaxis protein
MEGVVVDGQRSVLIVDRSRETREVLQTALERRGVRTLAAGRTEKGLELARLHQPDLIVLDLELEDMPDCLPVGQAFLPDRELTRAKPRAADEPETAQYQPQMILLGSLRGLRNHLPEGEFVRKPYHYGPLIRKIEELLASVNTLTPRGESGPCRRCLSSAEPIREHASN